MSVRVNDNTFGIKLVESHHYSLKKLLLNVHVKLQIEIRDVKDVLEYTQGLPLADGADEQQFRAVLYDLQTDFPTMLFVASLAV
jgi:hypothetical protein